jgi:hypothetical protein
MRPRGIVEYILLRFVTLEKQPVVHDAHVA